MLASLLTPEIWVQIAMECLINQSIECDPGIGYKLLTHGQHGTVRKLAKRRSSNLRDCLWVRLPPVLFKGRA